MTVTPGQIDIAKAKGLTNVEALAAACDKYRFPFYLACTILEKETGGVNVYGHDRGGVFNVPGLKEVTETNYREFKRRINSGEQSNGVGPMQITWKGFFPDMEGQGLKPWLPADNILYGIQILNRTWKSSKGSVYATAKAYNGGAAYGASAVILAKAWKTRVGTADLNASQPPPPTQPPSDPPQLPPFTATKPEAGSKTERVTFEGAKMTTRSRSMIIEARRLFREAGGGEPPQVSQGGFNPGGVKASGGTHDKEAADWATRLFAPSRRDLWQRALWQVGYPAWIRSPIPKVWPAHTHSVPAGGDLSPLAAQQVKAFQIGRDGLRGNARYPGILDSGYSHQTWEKYLADWKAPAVSVDALVAAFRDRTYHADVKDVQRALNRILVESLYVDGDPGPKTKAVYGRVDADGIPDPEVLTTRLGLEVTP